VADVEQMTLVERFKYLRLIQSRCLRSSRPERTALLTEAEPVTHLDRKTLIRRQHGNLTRKSRRQQRGRTYGRGSGGCCPAGRRDPRLPVRRAPAAHLAEHIELDLCRRLLDQLGRISVSTVTRMLRHLRRDQPRLPHRRPAQTNSFTRHVPAGRIARAKRTLGTSKRTSSTMPAHPPPACMSTPSCW